MSLKSFHVFFIVVAVLLCLGVTAWAFTSGGGKLNNGTGAMGLVSAALGVVIGLYGQWFVRKKASSLIV